MMCPDKEQTLNTVPQFSAVVKVLAHVLKIPSETREVI